MSRNTATIINWNLAFHEVFPTFVQHPWRAVAGVDVAPLRETPDRWRLKLRSGHRGVYRNSHGLPEFETRAEVYLLLRRYLDSRS